MKDVQYCRALLPYRTKHKDNFRTKPVLIYVKEEMTTYIHHLFLPLAPPSVLQSWKGSMTTCGCKPRSIITSLAR